MRAKCPPWAISAPHTHIHISPRILVSRPRAHQQAPWKVQGTWLLTGTHTSWAAMLQTQLQLSSRSSQVPFRALTRRPLVYRLSGSLLGLPRYFDASASSHLICEQIASGELQRAQEGHSDKNASGGMTEGVLIQGALEPSSHFFSGPLPTMAGS